MPAHSHERSCAATAPPLKPGPAQSELAMAAILTILVFLVAVAALNIFEFGRLD